MIAQKIKNLVLVKPYKYVHEKLLFSGRCNALVEYLQEFYPSGEPCSVLEVGCGDGRISQALMTHKPNLTFVGLEVVKRDICAIDYKLYNGNTLPFADQSFDYISFIDVLHHTTNAQELLTEARRVARKGIIIKDHYANNKVDFGLLALADWVGNWPYGVHLPFTYKSTEEWENLYATLALKPVQRHTKFKLHPLLLNTIYSSRVHFIVKLEKL